MANSEAQRQIGSLGTAGSDQMPLFCHRLESPVILMQQSLEAWLFLHSASVPIVLEGLYVHL